MRPKVKKILNKIISASSVRWYLRFAYFIVLWYEEMVFVWLTIEEYLITDELIIPTMV
jgi:uncharacterized protein YktB (UPF0637 family)